MTKTLIDRAFFEWREQLIESNPDMSHSYDDWERAAFNAGYSAARADKSHNNNTMSMPVGENQQNGAHGIGTKVVDTDAYVVANNLSRIRMEIHYPDCWDTAAYPTIWDALREIAGCSGCTECKPKRESVVDLKRMRQLLTLVRSSLGRKFQTSDYMPDRDEPHQNGRHLITDACAEFMGHQRNMHKWAEEAEQMLEKLENPTKIEAQQPARESSEEALPVDRNKQHLASGLPVPKDRVQE